MTVDEITDVVTRAARWRLDAAIQRYGAAQLDPFHEFPAAPLVEAWQLDPANPSAMRAHAAMYDRLADRALTMLGDAGWDGSSALAPDVYDELAARAFERILGTRDEHDQVD